MTPDRQNDVLAQFSQKCTEIRTQLRRIVVGQNEPIFYSAGATNEAARLSRVGGGPVVGAGRSRPNMKAPEDAPGVVAMCGPHAWIWRDGSFHVLDLREW